MISQTLGIMLFGYGYIMPKCFIDGQSVGAIVMFDGAVEKYDYMLIIYNVEIEIFIFKECIGHHMGDISAIHGLAMFYGPNVHVLFGNIAQSVYMIGNEHCIG